MFKKIGADCRRLPLRTAPGKTVVEPAPAPQPEPEAEPAADARPPEIDFHTCPTSKGASAPVRTNAQSAGCNGTVRSTRPNGAKYTEAS